MTIDAHQALSGADPLSAATIPAAFQRVVELYGTNIGLRTVDESVSLTWAEFNDHVREIACGLAGLGIGPGSTVGMILPNTIELHLIDFAVYHLGAIPFAIFNSSSTEQIAYQLQRSGTTIFFTERSFLERVRPAIESLDGQITHLVVVDGDGSDSLTLSDVVSAGANDFDFEGAWRA